MSSHIWLSSTRSGKRPQKRKGRRKPGKRQRPQLNNIGKPSGQGQQGNGTGQQGNGKGQQGNGKGKQGNKRGGNGYDAAPHGKSHGKGLRGGTRAGPHIPKPSMDP